MIVRCVKSALVSAAFLAALATSCGTAFANSSTGFNDPVKVGYQALQAGEADTAIQAFTTAIESNALQDEVLMNALLNRALAYQQKADHEKALEDYTAALAMQVMATPLRATALHNRGLSQHKIGKFQAAIEDYTASLLMNPKSSHAFYNRGNALRENGQFLFALSDYERALRNDHPDKARVLYASATTYMSLNRPADAKRALQAALDINPEFGQARAQLIMLGDQNAKLQTAEADPILTGSVSALAGGTFVTKPDLPKAVEPPEALVTAASSAKKKHVERVPEVSLASVSEDDVIAVDAVPAIPPPAAKPKAVAAKVVAKPVGEETASIDTPAPQAPAGAWTVQIASAASEDAAWATWKKMQGRSKALKGETAHVVRADLGKKGVFYRVRLGGFDDQKDAGKACAKLKAKGVNCFISKSSG